MKALTLFFVSLSLLCYSCNTEVETITIGQKNITNEIAGSNYRNKATEYFIINQGDTSNFRPIFVESKNREEVDIDLRLPFKNKLKTNSEILQELKQILPQAENDYTLDSLKGIFSCMFSQMGESAVWVTNKYIQKHGQQRGIPTKHYREICDLFLEVPFTKKLNQILKPYSVVMKKAYIEKAHFANKNYFLKNNQISMDSTLVPPLIIDGMFSIVLGRK